jgi:hypothetical protein
LIKVVQLKGSGVFFIGLERKSLEKIRNKILGRFERNDGRKAKTSQSYGEGFSIEARSKIGQRLDTKCPSDFFSGPWLIRQSGLP